jgi:hypothetical protein
MQLTSRNTAQAINKIHDSFRTTRPFTGAVWIKETARKSVPQFRDGF